MRREHRDGEQAVRGGPAALGGSPPGHGPAGRGRAGQDRVLLCIHGGGFVSGSMYTHRKMFGHLAKAAGIRALLVSCRLLPAGAYPVPVDDVERAYRWLLAQGIAPGHVAFAGDSTGGWLAITTQLRARRRGRLAGWVRPRLGLPA